MSFSIAAMPFYIPTNSEQNFNFSTSSLTIIIFCFFLIVILCVKWYLVVLICISLIYISLMMTFYRLVGLLYIFFGEISFVNFKSWVFWFLLLSCMSSLYSVDMNLLSDMRSANIYTVGCLFILLCPLMCNLLMFWSVREVHQSLWLPSNGYQFLLLGLIFCITM